MLSRCAFAFAALTSIALPLRAQNSTAKLRPEPSAAASTIGSAVPWRESVADALRESASSGKPVFWYVPTVLRSPMDRQVELDRYMLSGPFSWPGTITLLRECFVPLRAVPDREQQERYDLRPGRFIEPGYLVLNGDGAERARLDQLTTFHREWFLRRLIETLPESARARAAAAMTAPSDDAPTLDLVELLYTHERPGTLDIEHAEWLPAEPEHPNDVDLAARPVRAKLAAEQEGHGPFRYGFEVPFALPDAVLEAPVRRGTLAPEGAYDPAALRACGLRFFEWMQHPDGGFTDSRYDFGGTDSLPNVWAAVTALAGRAMLDVGPRLDDEAARMRASKIAELALDYLTDEAHLNLDDRDELAWALIYRARFACDWLNNREDRQSDAFKMLAVSIGRLLGLQSESGAWFHEYANPFVTASALLAIAESQRGWGEFTITAAQPLVDRGLAALRRCRATDGAISYSDTRGGKPRAELAGSVGRMPVVAHALARFDADERDGLAKAIERAFEFHAEMDAVRKYDDHASRLGYGGFFFWYGMHGRAEAIAALPDGEQKETLKSMLRAQVMALPEIDGCFVDSHELGRVYGTAMALLCLGLTEPAR